MDAEIIKSFLSEAESYLPAIRQSIEAFQSDNSKIEEIQTAHRYIHTIKGAALMTGFSDVSDTAKEIEDELEIIAANGDSLNQDQADGLFLKLTLIEVSLIEAGDSIIDDGSDSSGPEELFEMDEQEAEMEADEEMEISLETGDESEASEEEEDFDLDEEMLEVFAMEAEDHLQTIARQLELLEKDANNREALLEIRRSAHTLKGAAGICGFKKISDLAHRMEDLLDYLAENEAEGTLEIFNVLLSSTDCLERFANGENSDELNDKVLAIYGSFDEVFAKFKSPAEIAAEAQAEEEAEEEIEAAAEIEAEIIETALEEAPAIETIEAEKEDVVLIEEEIPAPSFANESNELLEIELLEEQYQIAAPKEKAPKGERPAERSVVRVSLERLDELVKLVGEMVLSRSVFEQRLTEFERQIQELQHTTGRLRGSTNRLEIDFEARTLKSSPFIFSSFTSSAKRGSLSQLPKDGIHEFDTLEFDQYTDFHQTTRELIETSTDTASIGLELDVLFNNLETLFSGQRRMIDEMQEKLLRLRMVPLSTFASRLQRTVKVTANQENKNAVFLLEGDDLEIDTQIVDALAEPLLHILRNAVAHGIETPEVRKSLKKGKNGKIQLSAYSEGTHIVIKVSDDGKGISTEYLKEKAIANGFITSQEAEEMSEEEALDLIFVAGFSTAEKLSQVSGRGVGMDIVRSSILRKQGEISVASELGKGTTFTIRVPMALAVTRSLLVKASGQTFAFPLSLVKQVVELPFAEVKKVQEAGMLELNNNTYAISFLADLLNLPATNHHADTRLSILLIETPDKSVALVADQTLKPQELVIKPLNKPLNHIRELLGATVLGDGSVVPVIDLIYLLKRKASKSKKQKAAEQKKKNQISVMIVDDSPSVRRVMSNLVTNSGWKPLIAKDGLEALEAIQSLTESEVPDIILTDVEMPRMDGYEFLASLNRYEHLCQIPVIMITSRAGDKHRRKAYDLGVSEYLVKPYEEGVLTEMIKRLAHIK